MTKVICDVCKEPVVFGYSCIHNYYGDDPNVRNAFYTMSPRKLDICSNCIKELLDAKNHEK
jgi:hypothetical protein